jgi:predicted ATPase/DNA-binding SARP family transcriptional activator/tetratricopeptide (TPR) repeat protein
MVQFRLLGSLDIETATGASIDLRGSKARKILALLLIQARQITTIDQIADVVWGDDPPQSTSNALHVQISKLRRVFADAGEELPLVTINQGYLLDVDDESIDTRRFSRLVAEGRVELDGRRFGQAAAILRGALDLWRGPALAEFAFEPFADVDRLRLEETRLLCLEDRIEADLALGRHAAVVAELEALVTEFSTRERLWGQLMLAQYRSERQADALRTFQRARASLIEEMGLEPGAELRALEQSILDRRPTLDLDTPRTAATVVAMPTTNVRPELSTYVGRANEMAAVTDLLADRRLVTLLGPGGVGKTRMATEIALRSHDLWPEGAWMIELGDVAGERAVEVALRSVFAGRLDLAAETDVSGSVVDGLAAQLGDARVLLIFDNCEHVIADAGRAISTLLRACPEVRVLTTSREVLSVPGETVRQIAPLEWAEAIELFSSRGADAKESFAVDARNEAAVRTICERLDRLPLGIELAAARLRAFTPDQLASRLSERLGSFGVRSELRATRQQTMHDAVDWSYALLFADERLLLRRLAVFPASFGLEAIEAVAADDQLDIDDISDVLARLIDKSLVVAEPSEGEQRYRLLRTVADFAGDRLAQAGETTAMRDRHADWVGDFAKRARVGLRGPEHSTWTGRIGAELPDIFRASQWVLNGGDPVRGLQIAADMGWYAFTSTMMTDFARDVVELLDHTADVPTGMRSRAMAWAGALNAGTDAGQHLGSEAVALARESDDAEAVAEAAIMLAMSLVLSPRTAAAGVHYAHEGLDAARRAGDPWLGALAVSQVGMAGLTVGTEVRDAATALAEAAETFRNLGDERTAILVDLRWTEAAEMNGDMAGAIEVLHRAREHEDIGRSIGSVAIASRLAWFSVRQGHAAQALAYATEVLDAANPAVHAPPRAMAHFALGAASMMTGGDRADARHHLTTALQIHEAVGSTRHLVLDHSILGYLDAQQGDHESSARHHERALALGNEIGLALPLAYAYEKCALSMVLRGDAHGAADTLARGEALRRSAGLERTEVEERTFWRVRNRVIELAGVDEVAAIEERVGVLL